METTTEELDAMLNMFVRATFTITHRAVPSIIKQKGNEHLQTTQNKMTRSNSVADRLALAA